MLSWPTDRWRELKLLERKIDLKGVEDGGDIQDYRNMLRKSKIRCVDMIFIMSILV